MEQIKWYVDKVFAVLQSQRFWVAVVTVVIFFAGKGEFFTDEQVAEIAGAVILVVNAVALVLGYSYRMPSTRGEKEKIVVIESEVLPKDIKDQVTTFIRENLNTSLSEDTI